MAADTTYGVMTLWESDNPENTISSYPGDPTRMELFRAWLDQASEIGTEVVRIPGSWEGLEPTEGQYSDLYVQEITAILQYAGEIGIDVIWNADCRT